jgi:hypothetical protein
MRRRTKDGGRVSNPAFRRAHWQAQAAVMHFEAEEERWHAFLDAEQAERMRKDDEKRRREAKR